MSSEDLLDALGARLMQYVRDQAIADWDMILERAKGAHAERVRELLASFSKEQEETLKRLIPEVVDSTIYWFLWAAEEGFFTIGVNTDSGMISDIRNVAKGDLQGYLYIWAPMYSKERHNTITGS